MLCKKAENAKGKEVARILFRHPLKIYLPPPGRNSETAPDMDKGQWKTLLDNCILLRTFKEIHEILYS